MKILDSDWFVPVALVAMFLIFTGVLVALS